MRGRSCIAKTKTIKTIIKKLLVEGSFVQNVAFSMSGNAVVLGISFILTPVIARIYGPDAYGQFALFTAVVSFIQPFSTLQFQAGYVAMKPDYELYNILKITGSALFLMTLLSLLAIIIIDLGFDGLRQDYSFFYLMPLYIFFAGVFNVLRGINIKLEEFRRSAISKSVATTIGKAATLGYGYFLTQSTVGMVLGGIITFFVEGVGYISRKLASIVTRAFQHQTSFSNLKAALFKYREYPLFVLPNTLASSFGNQLPVYFFSYYYSSTEVGLYSLSLALLTIPVNLFGTSVGAVLLPRISNTIDDKSARNNLLSQLYNKIFYPGLLGLIFLSLILYYLLPLILGENWSGIGQLTAVLALGFTMHLLAIPISVVYRLINYERKNLIINLSFAVLKILGLYIGWLWGSFQEAVFVFVAVGLVHNGIQVLILIRKLGMHSGRHLFNLMMALILFTLACVLIPGS